MNSRSVIRGSVAASALAVVAFAALQATAAEVTFDRLKSPEKEPQNWLTNHYNYEAWRHSPLDQINRGNARNLKFAYSLALGGFQGGGSQPHGALQGTPLVEDGMMYTTDGWGSVYKIDVRKGNRPQFVWKMDPGTDPSVPSGGLRNRGPALLGNLVYSVNNDGRVLATNAQSGELVWDNKVANQPADYLSVAPLALKNMVVVGSSGADAGARGWIDAVDATTGNKLWRTWLIPGPGEPGHETWADNWDAWKTGGGSAWVTGSYDKGLDTLIWGVGNPAPDFDNAYRPGDNLYTNSVLGMNPGTGKINWYFQYTPNDAWDFDEVGTHLLIDATIDGQPRKAMAHSARNGFYYFLDRTNGSFINGAVYSKDVNWTTGLDPKTGKPLSYDPTKKVQNYVAGTIASNQTPQAKVCPNIGGGNNYFPSAYSPKTNLFYAIGNESCSDIKKTTFEPGKFKLRDPVGFGNVTWGGRHTSSITAISVATGKMVKRMDYPYSNYGGLLSTAGGILVTGYLDGSFVVNDDTSLEELFTIYLGSPINAPPITYSVGGKQYLAILVGVGPIAKGRNTNSPEIKNLNSTSMLYAFTL